MSASFAGARAYAQIEHESSVLGATPYELVSLLFNGARRAIARARLFMQRRDHRSKGQAIGHALNIIGGGLQQGLNLDAGGDLAQRLNALYDYMTRRLLEASLRNDEAMLIEVDRLLATVEEGWHGIGATAARSPVNSF